MERIILKHLSGSKTGQVDEFPLKHFTELLIGRDPSATLQFHPELDDLVGRRHAKIEPVANASGEFVVVDLASRNGTFLNRQRIYQATRISPGDILQLGPGGPELEFQVDAPTAPSSGAQRPAQEAPRNVHAPLPAVTRGRGSGESAGPETAPAKKVVGAATVERMVQQSVVRPKRSYVALAALVMGLIAVGLVAFLYLGGGARSGGMSLGKSSVVSRNAAAIVSVEASWKIYDIASGQRLFHSVVRNPIRGQLEQFPAIGSRPSVPLFARYPDGSIEPVLTIDSNNDRATPFGAGAVASGFVVTDDGFILTSRQVAAGWDEPFRSWPARSVPGLVAVFAERSGELQWVAWDELLQPPSDWVPSRTRLILPVGGDIRRVRLPPGGSTQRAVQGRHDYMDVRFARAESAIPASLGRVSDRYSVALIKIESPQTLHTANLGTDDGPAMAGDRVVVMGFPRVAPAANAASRPPRIVLADPTVHVGYVGWVMADTTNAADELDRLCPRCYQLDAGNTGMSHSGGPVFNERGEVMGLFHMLVTREVTASLSIPIRVGRALMGVQAGNQRPASVGLN